MTQATTDYAITVDDRAAYRALLKLQSDIGRGTPPPGQAQFLDFFGIINDIAYIHYRLATNAQVKSWMDAVFNVVMGTNTCYTVDGKNLTTAGLYVLYLYYQFNATCMNASSATGAPCLDCVHNGFPIGTGADQNQKFLLPNGNETLYNAIPWGWFVLICRTPTTVPSFYNAIQTNAILLNHGLVLQKGSTATIAICNPGPAHTLDQVQQFQQSRFDPANWTDSNTFVQNIQKTTIWQDQSNLVTSLLKEPTLTADAYFYLLHLLIGLGTSNPTDQQLARTIVNIPVNSMEYPNDTFINQLMYATLMYFTDPVGEFGYDNTQLQGLLNDISNVIVSTDPASAAIKQSLTKSLKILHSDSSYPMTDPYNTNIDFNIRIADTLAALDSARSSLA